MNAGLFILHPVEWVLDPYIIFAASEKIFERRSLQ